MHITVCIPTYHRHLKYLQECLDSIKAQTVLPDRVVLSVSSVAPEDITPFRTQSYPFEVVWLTTTRIQMCAANKNCAARAAIEAGTDFLSFFDSDDRMHPRRMEYIRRAAEEGGVFIIHSNASWNPVSPPIWDMTSPYTTLHGGEVLKKERMLMTGSTVPIEFFRPLYYDDDGCERRLQTGQLSIHMQQFPPEGFPEDSYVGCEDTYFTAVKIRDGLPLTYIPIELTAYRDVPLEEKTEQWVIMAEHGYGSQRP